MNLPPSPKNNIKVISNFLNIRRAIASQGAPPVSTTLVANLPPFVNYICGKFATGVNAAGSKFAAGEFQ
jgi:hypothetical protein